MHPDQLETQQRISKSGDAKFYSRTHDAVVRVYDPAANMIETHEHAGSV